MPIEDSVALVTVANRGMGANGCVSCRSAVRAACTRRRVT
jgi:hypothetical protein